MATVIDRFSYIRNPYDVLGILPTARQTEIKNAYRTKAKITHPDRNPSNQKAIWEKRFREVHEAYEILSNTQTRKNYDEYRDSEKSAGNNQSTNSWNKVRSTSRTKKFLKGLRMVLRHLVLDF